MEYIIKGNLRLLVSAEQNPIKMYVAKLCCCPKTEKCAYEYHVHAMVFQKMVHNNKRHLVEGRIYFLLGVGIYNGSPHQHVRLKFFMKSCQFITSSNVGGNTVYYKFTPCSL